MEEIFVTENDFGRLRQDPVAVAVKGTREALHQLFSVVAFLVTETRMNSESVKLGNFVDWIIDIGHFETLVEFIERFRHEACEIRVFCIALVRATCLQGHNPPGYLRGITRMRSSSFLSHPTLSYRLLLQADPDLLPIQLASDLAAEAVASGHLEAVKLLLSRDIVADCRAWTLGMVPRAASAEMMGWLIKASVQAGDTVHHDKGLNEALTLAILRDNTEAVQALLEVGAEPILSPELWARARRNPPIFELLISRAAVGQHNTVIMIQEAEKGNKAQADFLTERDLVGRDEALEHGLCQAILEGNLKATRTLLQRGVDPNATKYRLSRQKLCSSLTISTRNGWFGYGLEKNIESEKKYFNPKEFSNRLFSLGRLPFGASNLNSPTLESLNAHDECVSKEMCQRIVDLNHPIILALYKENFARGNFSQAKARYMLFLLLDSGARLCEESIHFWLPDMPLVACRILFHFGYDILPWDKTPYIVPSETTVLWNAFHY